MLSHLQDSNVKLTRVLRTLFRSFAGSRCLQSQAGDHPPGIFTLSAACQPLQLHRHLLLFGKVKVPANMKCVRQRLLAILCSLFD